MKLPTPLARTAPYLALALCLFWLPESAQASEGADDHGESLKLLGIAALQLAILLGVLWRFGRAPIAAFLFQRSDDIRRKLESSQAELRTAQAEIERLKSRLAALSGEARDLVQLAETQAAGERERMEQRARETAERIRAEAERVADVETERARQALRAEASRLATGLAADLLKRELQDEDDARLIGEFARRLEEVTH